MTYSPDTPIVGRGGSIAEALDRVGTSNAAYTRELFRLCQATGISFAVAFAQFCHETADGTSPRWLRNRNPAGLGIESDSDPDPATWTQEEAARVHVWALWWLVASIAKPWNQTLPASAIAFTVRWDGKTSDPGYPHPVRTIADLQRRYVDWTGEPQAVWAWDDQYAAKLAAKANAIFREESPVSTLQFGNVAHPPFVDRLIPDSENRAWNDLGPRRALGVCQHSMVGTLWGTDGWFRRGAASTGLTDYGIGNSTDGPEWDGVILRWNDPLGRRAGWANGGSDGLEMDGPLFVRTLGVDAINRDLVSIERSDGGDTSTPMSAKQFDAICRLTAHWFDRARVPYDRFPLNPAYGIVTHFLHLEFATKTCPHPPVTDRIDEIQDRVRAILKAAQLVEGETPSVPPVTPPAPDHDALPNGWTFDELKARFRRPMHERLNPKENKRVGFNLQGAISNAWLARAVDEGITSIRDLPVPQRMVDIAQPDSGLVSTIVAFDGRGTDNWCLFRPDASIAWRWIQ